MKLYHGTTAEVARKAIQKGLRPRGKKKSNWTIKSRYDLIYLTTAYAPYFAFCTKADKLGILEIDTDLLDKNLFLPDEDFMEQATRSVELMEAENMVDRTTYFRRCLDDYQLLWERSIEGLGNCAYRGIIPPEAITGAVVFDYSMDRGVKMLTMDPSITIANYQLCGHKYRKLTSWFFDQELEEDDNTPAIAKVLSQSINFEDFDRKGVERIL